MSLPATFFLFDIGTTGNDPLHDHVHTLVVRPHSPSSPSTSHLHQRTRPSNTLSPRPYSPPFENAWPSLVSFIDEHTAPDTAPLLVANNLSFDLKVLHAELSREQLAVPAHWRFECSLDLLRGSLDEFVSQSDLAVRYAVRARRDHDAEDGVRTLSAILTQMECGIASGVHEALVERAVSLTEHLNNEAFQDNDDSTDTGRWIVSRTGGRYGLDEGCTSLTSARETVFTERPVANVTPSREARFTNGQREDPPGKSPHSWTSVTTTLGQLGISPDHGAPKNGSRSGENGSVSVTGEYLTTDEKYFFHLDPSCSYLPVASFITRIKQRPSNKYPCKCAGEDFDEPTGRYITTKTGKYYHLNRQCECLQKASGTYRRIAIPAELRACYMCV